VTPAESLAPTLRDHADRIEHAARMLVKLAAMARNLAQGEDLHPDESEIDRDFLATYKVVAAALEEATGGNFRTVIDSATEALHAFAYKLEIQRGDDKT
jgi:hypothetical protein